MGNHTASACLLADSGQHRQGKCKCFEGRAFPLACHVATNRAPRATDPMGFINNC